MKKSIYALRTQCQKYLLTFKLVLVFILLSISSGFADSDVYSEMLTLNLEDVTFDEVVEAIEAKSEYVFYYKSGKKEHILISTL